MTHPFDTAINLTPQGEDRFGGATSPAYANMVGPFGGVTSGALLNAVLLHPRRQGEPIALTVNFAAPMVDGSYEIEARPVRTNRSTQHWNVRLLQGGDTVCTATAVLALRRETWSAQEARPPLGMPPTDSLLRTQFAGRSTWLERYDMRFVEGALPEEFDGLAQPHANTRVWVRDDPPRRIDFPSLAAICDSFLPRIFIRRRTFVPIGTVTITTFFHADAGLLAAQGDRHVAGCARALSYRNGYFDQSAEVWSDDMQMLASTHQMVYFRE